jgi:feruloyl esterase
MRFFLSLIAWRERGRAPERVIATKFESADPKRIAFQRPLCAFPRQAIYSGNGSKNRAEHFACGFRSQPSH